MVTIPANYLNYKDYITGPPPVRPGTAIATLRMKRHRVHGFAGRSGSIMMTELITLTEEMMTFRTDRPETIGATIDVEIPLPARMPMQSFVLSGIITGCKPAGTNKEKTYLVEARIKGKSSMNHKILIAYLDFLKRDKMLHEARKDFDRLQQALTELKIRFTQLAAAVELLHNNAMGTLEIIKRERSGKTTLH